MNDDFDPWRAMKWIGYLTVIAAAAHGLAAVLLDDLAPGRYELAEAIHLVVHAALIVGVFGPVLEPVIAAEARWGDRKSRAFQWLVARCGYLLAIVAAGLLSGRFLGPAVHAVLV